MQNITRLYQVSNMEIVVLTSRLDFVISTFLIQYFWNKMENNVCFVSTNLYNLHTSIPFLRTCLILVLKVYQRNFLLLIFSFVQILLRLDGIGIAFIFLKPFLLLVPIFAKNIYILRLIFHLFPFNLGFKQRTDFLASGKY